MKMEYREISKELLSSVKGNAWSLENMEAHEVGERTVDYIGSRTEGNIIFDYYRDNAGDYWYQNRAIAGGKIVTYEEFIFGHEIRRKSAAVLKR